MMNAFTFNLIISSTMDPVCVLLDFHRCCAVYYHWCHYLTGYWSNVTIVVCLPSNPVWCIFCIEHAPVSFGWTHSIIIVCNHLLLLTFTTSSNYSTSIWALVVLCAWGLFLSWGASFIILQYHFYVIFAHHWQLLHWSSFLCYAATKQQQTCSLHQVLPKQHRKLLPCKGVHDTDR